MILFWKYSSKTTLMEHLKHKCFFSDLQIEFCSASVISWNGKGSYGRRLWVLDMVVELAAMLD